MIFPRSIKGKPGTEQQYFTLFIYIYHNYLFLPQSIFSKFLNSFLLFWITDVLRNFPNPLFSFLPVPLKCIQNREMEKWLRTFYVPSPFTTNTVWVILDHSLSEASRHFPSSTGQGGQLNGALSGENYLNSCCQKPG